MQLMYVAVARGYILQSQLPMVGSRPSARHDVARSLDLQAAAQRM